MHTRRPTEAGESDDMGGGEDEWGGEPMQASRRADRFPVELP